MKLLLLSTLLGFASIVRAQTIEKAVISSGGEAMTNREIHLNSTIGEPLIGLVINDFSVDQGFWANNLTVEPLATSEELNGIVVFPNPVVNELNIFTNNKRVFGLTLFSVDGRMVFRKKVDEAETTHQIDTSTLSKGIYVLQVLVEGDSKEKLFKIIKN